MKRNGSIRNIHDLVTAFGGSGKFADWLGVTGSYVSNMLARGYLPGGFHMRVYVELKRRGLTVSPELFDLEPDDADFFKRLSVRSRKRKAEHVQAA
jgi:hypothetical protein